MVKVLALVAVIWLLLMPPLFTAGECTREFDEEYARIERERESIRGVREAVAYWNARGITPGVLGVDQCRRARPRDLARCPAGPIVQAGVPVKNLVCKIYRDDEVRVRFIYDENDRMSQVAVDMKPFYSLPIPGVVTVHWAR